MFFRKIGLLAGIGAAALIFGTSMHTHAENLHKKYRDLGDSSWNCNRIVITDPRAAQCAACKSQGKDYDDIGTCVTRESVRDRAKRAIDEKHNIRPKMTAPSAPRDNSKVYGALAYKKITKPDGDYTFSGVGYGPTEIDAEGAAKSDCNSFGGSFCEIVGNFSNGGCGYIVLCANKEKMSYGAGKTKSEARTACLGGRFDRVSNGSGGCSTRTR